MGCTRRHFLLSTCFLQLISITERQVFDFLGYMWAPILINFFHIIFVIFGFYGAYHFRVKYIITYLLWSFLWIGWNAFLICFYLDIGVLDKNSDILNLGTGSASWFEVNGYGCKPIYPINITSEDPYRPVRPERVDDCLLEYPIVEIIHSGVQCFLAVFAIIGAILIAYLFIDEDDQLTAGSKKSKHRQSLYSIEYGSPIDTIRSRDTILDYDDPIDDCNNGQLSPKPMTPRRVKRRSVMTRGTNGRQSTTSRRSQTSGGASGGGGGGGVGGSGTSHRSSTRSSRRKHHHHAQNPVTKIMEQQQLHIKNHQQQQQQTQHSSLPISTIKPPFASFQHVENPTLTASNLQSLNNEILSNIKPPTNKSAINYKSFKKNISPDPIYYNMSGAMTGGQMPPSHQHNHQQQHLHQQPQQQQQQQQQQQSHHPQQPSPSWNNSNSSPIGTPTLISTPNLAINVANNNNNVQQQSYGGHYNPTYQHSTSNLTTNENEHVDELYNNRPPSVRSSYSNFHGTRPLSSYNPTISTTENVFAGITSGISSGVAVSGPQHQQLNHQQHHHNHLPSTSSTSSQAQVIPPTSRRSASRESVRSMAFLNNGPPAYNLNYHTPPDSETTM